MTEEEKAAETAKAESEETTEENKEADAEPADETNESEEETKAKHDDKKIDYEAKLKEEREAREKAEKALAEDRYKSSKDKRKEEETEEEEEEKPLTASQLDARLARERESTQKELRTNRMDAIAEGLSGSNPEKELLMEIWRNRTFPSHLTDKQVMDECYVIANGKKLVGERDEALRGLKGKEGVETDSTGTHRDPPQGPVTKTAPEVSEALKAAGMSYNTKSRQWEKKFENGDMMVGDPTTGQTQLIKKS